MWQIFGMEEVAAKIMINRNDAGLLLHSWQDRGKKSNDGQKLYFDSVCELD